MKLTLETKTALLRAIDLHAQGCSNVLASKDFGGHPAARLQLDRLQCLKSSVFADACTALEAVQELRRDFRICLRLAREDFARGLRKPLWGYFVDKAKLAHVAILEIEGNENEHGR